MNDTSWKGCSLADLEKNSPLSDLKVKKKKNQSILVKSIQLLHLESFLDST